MELNDPDGALTASFGCAQLHTNAPGDWFIRADQAAYQAKLQGRNAYLPPTKPYHPDVPITSVG